MANDQNVSNFAIQPFKTRASTNSEEPEFHWQYGDSEQLTLRSRDVYMLMYKKIKSCMLQTYPSQQEIPMQLDELAQVASLPAQVQDQLQTQVQAMPKTVPVSEEDAALNATLDAASAAAEEKKRKDAALLEKKPILEMEKAREEERVRKKKETRERQFALRYQKRGGGGGGGGRSGGRW
jgi:hypothetical protein